MLNRINPSQIQTMAALYADYIFDVSDYRQVECESFPKAVEEIRIYRADSKVITSHITTGNYPITLQLSLDSLTSATYLVYTIPKCGDLIKNFRLSGHLENVVEVLVTTGNTVIYSTTDIDNIASYPFFTSWFPDFISSYTQLKVYIQLKETSIDPVLSLSYEQGFLPTETRASFMAPINSAVDVHDKSFQTPKIESSLVPIINMLWGLAGLNVAVIEKPKLANVQPPDQSVAIGLFIKPYGCILYNGVNIAGNLPERHGYCLASSLLKDSSPAGTVTMKGIGAWCQFTLSQFGQAHRNIRVSCNVPAKVSLLIGSVIYYQQLIEAGKATLIHDIPIIHAKYNDYVMEIFPVVFDSEAYKNPFNTSIETIVQWDPINLKESKDSSDKIVIPEFNLVSCGGVMIVRDILVMGRGPVKYGFKIPHGDARCMKIPKPPQTNEQLSRQL